VIVEVPWQWCDNALTIGDNNSCHESRLYG
jgi:hypothetical protein